MGTHVSCIYNPAAGRERELGFDTITVTEQPRNVAVVGAGPAGLEAARVAALCGHHVSVYEREAEPGGQLRFAATLSSQPEIGGVLDFLLAEVERLGVSIDCGTEMTIDALIELEPDAVVVATGSSRARTGSAATAPTYGHPGHRDGERADAATDPCARLRRRRRQERPRLDFEGHVQAMTLAEHLLDLGASVEIATPHPYLGPGVGGTRWIKLTQRLAGKGIVIHPNTMIGAVAGQTWQAHAYGGASTLIDNVDAIVIVGDSVADDDLSRELGTTKHGWQVISVGDCVAPRRLEMAVLEGHRAGRAL